MRSCESVVFSLQIQILTHDLLQDPHIFQGFLARITDQFVNLINFCQAKCIFDSFWQNFHIFNSQNFWKFSAEFSDFRISENVQKILGIENMKIFPKTVENTLGLTEVN